MFNHVSHIHLNLRHVNSTVFHLPLSLQVLIITSQYVETITCYLMPFVYLNPKSYRLNL